MTTATLIRLAAIRKTYGQGEAAFQALRGVDLSIEAAEFVAVMGPSGSGKSTVMNILGCLDVPSEGAYLFHGEPVEQLNRQQRALLRRHYLGFVFQGFNLLARTSAQENVELPLLYRGLPASERHALAAQRLGQVGLSERMDHHPAQVSGGQQQRVAIARALVGNPSLLLADEPTGALDTRTGSEIMALLQQLNQECITIVLVTLEHDIAAYADRIIHFRDGRVVTEST
jgi:putative ABC transport system ATP-binding protein